MVVGIDEATGAGPTWTAGVTSVVWNQADSASGTSNEIPTPVATGTAFSYIKTFQLDITTTNSLTMTNVLVGKVAAETTTGTKLWLVTSHASTSYVQATAAPTSTSDNNVTAPTINSATGVACPLISAPPAAYAAGPFTTTGRQGNIVEVCLGVDFSNVTGGTSVATPTLRWSWTEGHGQVSSVLFVALTALLSVGALNLSTVLSFLGRLVG